MADERMKPTFRVGRFAKSFGMRLLLLFFEGLCMTSLLLSLRDLGR